jgi:hypothetical protein
MDKALTESEFNWLISQRCKSSSSDYDIMTTPLNDQERYELNIKRYRKAVGLTEEAPFSSVADAIIFELNRHNEVCIGEIQLFKFNESNVSPLSTVK